jgi:spore germination protein YaaH
MKWFSVPVALIALFLSFGVSAPKAHAAGFEVSGWIPYWAASEGIRDAAKHLDILTSVYPFSFSVNTNGSLKDLADMGKGAWKRFVRQAKIAGVEVIPTVMWSNTERIHEVLSDKKLRASHIEAIVKMVDKGGYDGVDIDYEGKKASTRPHYSAFLKELKAALGGKILSCTIEARTPPDSLYTSIPKNLEYANDYAEINTYCDRVNIMAYDQQRADLKLNSARVGGPYYPNADLAWVKKVMALTSKTIDKDKLLVGVPTYGRELEVTVSPNWFQSYKQLWSVSDEYARDTADKYDVTPVRNAAGELSYSYVPTKSGAKLLSSVSLSSKDSKGDEIAARALAYANKTGKTTTVHTVWWSDAQAVADKVALAREMGLRGVALFKIDGNEDKDLWDAFK